MSEITKLTDDELLSEAMEIILDWELSENRMAYHLAVELIRLIRANG